MIKENLQRILTELPEGVSLVAVSKTKTSDEIMQAYAVGQRIFGENKVQELVAKNQQLPKDIQWHMIGHLQRNKVKYIAPFVALIHSVDSLSLLQTINKEAEKNNRIVNCLLEIYIASEESKYGLDENEADEICKLVSQFSNIRLRGLMGMASYTKNTNLIHQEFKCLKHLFDKLKNQYFENEDSFNILSMGMSGDYLIAINEGSNMVRIGSSIFGERNYSPKSSDESE